jgi:excisionase family DNA binding protein
MIAGSNPADGAHLPIDPMSEHAHEILTIEEAAAYLEPGRITVYRLAAGDEIPAFKVGGTWRFRRSELDSWIAARIHINKNRADG